jgi:Phosphotransferase enzyme family
LASAEQNERETYRVIVLSPDGTKVLLVLNGERQMLPSVKIPRWQRVAENLTAAVGSNWGEEVVCLFDPDIDSPTDGAVTRYQVAEHLCTRSNPKMPTYWVPVSMLSQDSLADRRDYAAIKQVGMICNGGMGAASAGPFSRLGWFNELRNWVDSVVESMGLHVNGRFQQLNASASFSLIRFETNGPALWFKAVGEPNQREFTITCLLAQLFPEYLPRILGCRPDWNGWLTREAPGKLLSDLQEQVLWEQASASLAKLQIQSIDRGSQVLGAGARDLGSAELSKLIQPFISVVAQLMERQTKSPPPSILGRKDLSALADSLQSAVDTTKAIGIPETIGHLDLNPGNIIGSENRCAFLDWAEAYVGNPLLSLEYLLEHARRTFGPDSAVVTKMTAAYCAQWDGVVSPAAIADALAFAPLLAVFAYAAGNDLWNETQRLEEPATAGYLRSLARRMHREARELADRGAPCLQ